MDAVAATVRDYELAVATKDYPVQAGILKALLRLCVAPETPEITLEIVHETAHKILGMEES